MKSSINNMSEKLPTTKNEQAEGSQEAVQDIEAHHTMESLHVMSETDENLEKKHEEQLHHEQELLAQNIEQEISITEETLKEMHDIIEHTSTQEAHALNDELEKKGFFKKLQEAGAQLAKAQAHAEEELSETYNKKLVERIGLAGKMAGGLAGLFGVGIMAGGGLYGGAVAAIGGSKAGGYGALKLFDKIASALPESWQKALHKKEAPKTEGMPLSEWMRNPEYHLEEIQRLTQENAEMHKDIEGYIEEINNMDPKRRQRTLAIIAENPKTLPLFEKIKNTSKKYNSFWHEFEHTHPNVAMGLEFVTHISIPLATKGMLEPEMVKTIIIQLESFLAGGGGEKITAAALAETKEAKRRIMSFVNPSGFNNN